MPDGYDLDASLPAVQVLQAGYVRDSEAASRLPNARLDLAYGRDPRHRLDLFPAVREGPALVFFHGGYWRAGSKESRRFPATEWNRRGVTWIPANYRLAPEHSVAHALADARAAVRWIAKNASSLGIDPGLIHVTGNSAGAQLAAMVAAAGWEGRPDIASLTVVSGLFDLAPLLSCDINDSLALTHATVREVSPLYHMPPIDLPVLIAWGGDETNAFANQSRAYAAACQGNRNPVEAFDCPGKDHFAIIGEYAQPGTPLFDGLARHLGVAHRKRC